jgi:hypothetical protein
MIAVAAADYAARRERDAALGRATAAEEALASAAEEERVGRRRGGVAATLASAALSAKRKEAAVRALSAATRGYPRSQQPRIWNATKRACR